MSTVLRAESLAALPGVIHGFSQALYAPADHAAFAAAAGASTLPVLRLRQVHGDVVVRAKDAVQALNSSPNPAGEAARLDGDALVASDAGFAIAVASADCVPILLADPVARVVAAVHAGWRGMRARVILRAVEEMMRAGAEAARIHAAIGPAVQGSCYEVGDEVRREFEREFPDSGSLFSGRRLDLIRAARGDLARAGVPVPAMSVIERCTHCRSELASYRRDGAARGTNLALIALSSPAFS